MKKVILFLTTILLIFVAFYIFEPYNKSKEASTYYYGARGKVIISVQTKLRAWGYYSGSVDGIYGYKTFIAIKNFQRKNGLYPDGVIGNKTLAALGINTYTQNTSANTNVYLLARLISGESRGEPYIGQVAVGGVVLNRTRDPRFPSSVAGVIYQPGAFTAVSDGQINAEPQASCVNAARDAINGWDPSGGAIFYYNPAKTTNKWIWSRPVIKVIGDHIFTK